MSASAIEKYIDEEIEISKYKISTLKRSLKMKPSQKRVLDIEEELCSIPFKKLGFSSVSEVATAFRIFRESRAMFYGTYFNDHLPIDSSDGSIKKIHTSIEDKLDFLKHKSKDLMFVRPQEINLVQDYDSREIFFSYLAKKNSSSPEREALKFERLDANEYRSHEPSSVSRFRARKQASTMSTGKYMSDELDKVSAKYEMTLMEKPTGEELTKINKSIDDIYLNLNQNIYRNYNYALYNMQNVIDGSMGSNVSFPKINKLKNCLNDDSKIPRPINSSLDLKRFVVQNVCYGKKEPIKHSFFKDKNKNVSTKTYGILLPIKRVGNEKITPLYLDIWTDFDVCINSIICSKVSNVKAVDPTMDSCIYYKCVFLLPMWKVLEAAFSNRDIKLFLSNLSNINMDSIEKIDFNSKDQVSRLLSSSSNYANINKSKSSILVPSTRSEEHFFSANKERVQDYILRVSGYEEYLKKYTINNQIINV